MDDVSKSWILLGMVFSFMLCVFAPLEAYFVNENEFWFNLSQILPMTLAIFTIMFLISAIVGICIKKSRFAVWIYGFLFCTLLYLYIQGNYVPRDYGVLNGTDIQWDNYPMLGKISLILIFAFLVIWLLISLTVKEKIYKGGSIVCTILILIQLVTLVTLLFQSNGEMGNDPYVVTTNDMFNLSKNKNIIVFILDTVDSADMETLLNGKEGEKYKEILQDFTYYPDTLGTYTTTIGALPYILTGVEYQAGEKYIDWVHNGYANSKIYGVLEDNGYSVGLYTQRGYINVEYADNLKQAESVVDSYYDFAKSIYTLTAFNYMPHQLKKYFCIDYEAFNRLRSSKIYDVYSKTDTPDVYNFLKKEGLLSTDPKNSFRVYHMDGAHPPYTFDETLISEKDKIYDVYDEISGNLILLDEYFSQLREKELYDNTAIIVMADHGGNHGISQNPTFMIKNFDERHPFMTSDSRMSWHYLADIFVSLVSGARIDDVYIENCFRSNNSIREFSYYTWDDDWNRQYMPDITEYLVYGDARDLSASEFRDEAPYHLGDTLLFGETQTARKHCLFGIDNDDWICEHKAAMQFDFDEEYQNLLVNLEYRSVIASPQTVIVYANQYEVAEFVANSGESQEIIVPGSFVENGRLILVFECPDRVSPKELGMNSDIRELAIRMDNITISDTNEEVDVSNIISQYFYDLGRELSFSSKTPTANKYCKHGFSGSEDTHTWTDGREAELQFVIVDEHGDLVLNLDYFTYTDSQHVIIYANDNKIADYQASREETKTVPIPKDYVENGRLSLKFDLPDAVSPSSRGESEDGRVLGLAMKSLIISEAQ